MHTEQAGIGPLKIIVCIKQVPLLSALRFDQETHRLVREGVPLELNELDVFALTEAVRLRTLHGGEVIAITMGPPQAHEALATALAIGADRAIHLSDRAFSGADTAATAFTLSLAIAPEHPDLIFCGRHSIDAEHYSQVYKLAALLNAAIGATRNVTDRGWLPKQTQIGLTGRAVAPQLYLALGIRGAAEHIAGIRQANYIVSINKNRRAAIFRHSDLGVIVDVHILLPLLVEYLEYRINTQQASN